ncbi:helix-hairpin-helix domain-containing protein [Sporolactobacillus pectinivorans]|uniref:helix-hairpin-helix domain-containing protein n=1 Tax=Sporolactobacillus pectinivorans TaxID=1591408 RepID=UPI000C25A5B7|nr:helix-hairpin-helix domain-containing protein [Sporolactobacillus pectinivorans]
MDRIWKKYKIWLILVAVVFCLLIVLFLRQYTASEKAANTKKAETYFSFGQKAEKSSPVKNVVKQAQSAPEIIVDMKGAVRKPGIYRMSPADRVSDAINKAGGLADKADRDKINLAQKISDEMVVYVPEKGQDVPKGFAGGTASSGTSTVSGNIGGQPKVNINTADETDLQNLSGIGPAKAKAILQYREEHGPFKSVDDLTNVSGIGEKSLEKIKPEATAQ